MMAWMRKLLARAEITSSGYFDHIGWFETRARGRALDRHGEPIPWFTYPAIAYLDERIDSSWRVLEFGSGMGTLWWSQRVEKHIALEHDAAWAALVARSGNARVVATSDADAQSYIAPALPLGPFDVVIVDGLFRTECLAASRDLLAADGVILLDDAQRHEYAAGIEALHAAGFRQIAFHGPQPVSKHAGCTTVLYRSGNVLGI